MSFENSSKFEEDTKNAPFRFEQVRDFIDGTGRFRCDRDECFFGPKKKEQSKQYDENRIAVRFEISGPNPDSRKELDFEYPEPGLLWKLAETAYPGVA